LETRVKNGADVTERNLAAVAARKVEQYAMELRNKNEQLGVALTRHIVEAQGGSVAVHSELGRGSIFSAILSVDNVVRAPA
jgi:signal transduction histidine kinase